MATKAVGQITVFDYSDGYSVMLTNPSYTFIGDEDSVRGVQSVTTRVVAMQGASQINASVDTSQIIKPTGFTVTSNGATPSPTLTIQATQSVTDAGVLTIPVTVATGVTVSLQWSYSIAFTGGKGDTGDAGRGVTGTTVQYAPGTLPTTPPSSGWDDTVPSVDEGKYLWVKTVFTYSSGDPVTTYSVAKQGEKGSTGNGISSTVVEYAESTSGVTPPATIASWGSDIPNVAQGNYLWTRTTTNYTGSNPTVSYSVARIGMDGEPATTYSLIVSHAAIVKSASGTFSPTSITLTAKSQTGTNAYANYSGRFKIEVYNGSSWSTKYTSSSNENTKSYTIPSGTTQVRCSLYLAGGTTTLLDQQTIPVVSDGAAGGDAYTIILDNESHTFAGGTSAAIAGTATVNVYAYKGATAIAPAVTKANISGLPTGMSVQSVTNDSTNKKSTIVFAVTTSMVTRSGMVTIPVVADGKTFNKEFSYSLALQGTKGDTGDKGDKGDTGAKGDTGEKGDKGDKGDTGAKGDTGEQGIQGYSIVAYVTRNNFTEAEWTTYGTIDHVESWAETSGIRNGCRVGDLFAVVGTSTDGGKAHTAIYKSTTSSGNLRGTCIAHTYADKGDKGDAGRNGADHNLLMDVYASSLTKVDGPADRYLSDSSNSTTTGQFIAEANLPDPNATHFYRISATQAGKSRGLCWYTGTNPPIISGSTYRMGCYARASSGSPKMNLRFSSNSANRKYFTVSNTDWQWFEYTAKFEDNGDTAAVYKRTYFYCDPQAAGDTLDMCGFRLERVTDDVLAIKLTADTAKADAATAQSTADDAAALAQAAKDSADGKITTFYQNTRPTAVAVGDLWINTTNNQNALSRWNGTTWVPVDNKDLSTALQNAATAQATADGKIMTFAQNDAPTGTLDTGDLWVDTDDNNRLYRWNGTTWDEVTDKTNLVPNLTPWFDRPFSDVYNSTTNPNGYWNSTTLTSALTQLPDGWAHVDVTNSGTSNALLMRAVGRAVNGIVTGGNYTCLVEFRNVVNAAGIYSFYTQQSNGVQFWGDGSYDGFSISASLIVDGAKIYKPMKCVTGPTKSDTLNWLMRIASYIKPSQTVSYDFRVSLYEGDYSGPYKPYVDQKLRIDVDAAQTAANNAQTTADRKKQTFITTPTTPYYVGDIYFVDSKLLVCRTERLTGSYTADDWSEDLGYASANTVSDLENRTTSALDTITNEANAKYKIYDDKLEGIEGRFNSKVQQTSENFLIQFDGLLRSLNALSNETREKFADYSKYFRFTAEGLEIGEEKNALSLVLDNDKISFRRNGVEFSYWDGSDNSFHVGDIIVDVNQVARFGSFGLVPLEGGDLAWKWLGGST